MWSRDPRPCLSHLLLGTVAHACHMSKAGEGHPAPSLRPRAHLLVQGPSAATQPTLCPLLRCTALTGFKSHLLDLRVQGQKWLRCHRVLRLPLHTEVFPRRSGPRHPLPRAARSLVTAGHSRPAGVRQPGVWDEDTQARLQSFLAPGPGPHELRTPGTCGPFSLLAAAPTSLGPGPRALWALSGQTAWAQPCLPLSLGFPYFPRPSVFPSVKIGVNSLSPDPLPGAAARTEDAELGVPGCGLPAHTPSGRASAAA